MLHQTGLFFHMFGILLAGGGSVGSIMAETQLWKKVRSGSSEARAYLPILRAAATFIIAGVILFLLSGLIMLYSVNWVYLSQPWFIAKLVLFLTLPIRGATVGKDIVQGIGMQLMKDPGDLPVLLVLRKRMIRFHIIQFTIVATIIFLVLFKI